MLYAAIRQILFRLNVLRGKSSKFNDVKLLCCNFSNFISSRCLQSLTMSNFVIYSSLVS